MSWWEASSTLYSRIACLMALTALVLGCSSVAPVATPFTRGAVDYSVVPEEALRALAAEIEGEIAQGNREPSVENREGLVVDGEAVVQAIRTRAARAELVSTFLEGGHGWERRDGRIWVLRSEAYKADSTSRSRDLDALMINGENRDRWTLYETIIDDSDLPSKALSAIEEIFFEARFTLMAPGQKYENVEGDPVVKE